MARMSRKLEKSLSARLLPVVLDKESAAAARLEAEATLPILREDVEKLGTMTERARLARFLTEIAEWSLLLEEPEHVLAQLEEARALLEVDDRHAPAMLVNGRLGWFHVLDGNAVMAVELLQRVLADTDRSVHAWRDTHALYLAAAHLAQNDIDSAKKALSIAEELYVAEPKRDASLVREARQRLGQ